MSYVPVDWARAVRRECRRRRYSERTAKTYVYCIGRFLKFAGKGLDRISKRDVRLFLEHLSEKESAGNTMNVYHMAVRFLFEDVLDKRMWIDIKYSKVPERMPVVLAKGEVRRLFDAIGNEKHRLMAEFLYSSGLRVSELVNMAVRDLDITNGYGWVRGGKGNKDRLFVIADRLKGGIERLIFEEKLLPESPLFRSNRKGKYSIRSLQQVLKKAAKKSRIKKRVSPHTLRHSFATHLIENGYAVSEVQGLLGHKSPETTQIYLHAALPRLLNVRSPLDSL